MKFVYLQLLTMHSSEVLLLTPIFMISIFTEVCAEGLGRVFLKINNVVHVVTSWLAIITRYSICRIASVARAHRIMQTIITCLGDEIDWKNIDEGLIEAQEKHKPLMLIMHKSWCGACKAFKPKFSASEEIRKLSEQFVMVNTQDDEEPKDAKYTPDGGYIPRVLFLDPKGEVLADIYNKDGNPQYKYFYSNPDSVVASMKSALELVSDAGKRQEL